MRRLASEPDTLRLGTGWKPEGLAAPPIKGAHLDYANRRGPLVFLREPRYNRPYKPIWG